MEDLARIVEAEVDRLISSAVENNTVLELPMLMHDGDQLFGKYLTSLLDIELGIHKVGSESGNSPRAVNPSDTDSSEEQTMELPQHSQDLSVNVSLPNVNNERAVNYQKPAKQKMEKATRSKFSKAEEIQMPLPGLTARMTKIADVFDFSPVSKDGKITAPSSKEIYFAFKRSLKKPLNISFSNDELIMLFASKEKYDELNRRLRSVPSKKRLDKLLSHKMNLSQLEKMFGDKAKNQSSMSRKILNRKRSRLSRTKGGSAFEKPKTRGNGDSLFPSKERYGVSSGRMTYLPAGKESDLLLLPKMDSAKLIDNDNKNQIPKSTKISKVRKVEYPER